MKRRLLVSLAVVLTLCGCNNTKNNSTSNVSSVMSSVLVSIDASKKTINLIKGQHDNISPLVEIYNAAKEDIRYSCDNDSVEINSLTGEVIAKKEGTSNIKVSYVNDDKVFTTIKVVVESGNSNINDFDYYTFDSYKGRKHSLNSKGKQNVLVLPIEIKGFEANATSNNLQRINELFNGENNSKWESVSSYYKKSSYGQLDLNFIVPNEWFKCDLGPSEIYARKIEDDCGTATLINEGAQWYKEKYKPEAKTLDGNKDGFIDAIWAVFSAPSTTEYDYSSNYSDINPTMFWPLTVSSYLNMSDEGDVSNPLSKVYSWASFDCMDKFNEENTIDAHTFIHETGHMFGLKDYYSYGGGFETPLGCIDMMDCNIGDHNPLSKFSLGWTKPTVVDKTMTIELKPFESSGEFVLLGDDSYNGTAFDEYFTIDYLTPTGLNEADYTKPYGEDKLQGYSKAGIRILHVDNRCTNDKGLFVSDPKEFVNDPITNTSYDGYTKFYDSAMSRPMFQVTLMQKDCNDARKNVFSASNGYYSAIVNKKVDVNEALFHVGESFDLLESSPYCALMPSKSDRLDKYAQGRDKTDIFPYRVSVKEINKDKAVIDITRL